MTTTYYQRMGEGSRVEMTKEEIINDIEDGSNVAAERGRVPGLTDDEKEQLLDIFLSPERVASVKPGEEIVFSCDIGAASLIGNYAEAGGVGIPMDFTTANLVLERAFAHDIINVGNLNAFYKDIKPVAVQMQQYAEDILTRTITPLEYVAQPNIGGYYKPEGPYENVTDMISEGKIEEGLKEYEAAIPALTQDITWAAEAVINPIGIDCINLDTTGAGGDGDFLACLKATEEIKKNTKLSVIMGMSTEYVLGVHGGLQYDGKILAGMYPHEQVKVAQKAGVDIFGSVVNTSTKKSTPWNAAKTIVLTKQCVKDAGIPVHSNVGMGVGGIPMVEIPPIDAVTKCSKALVEIAGIDGI